MCAHVRVLKQRPGSVGGEEGTANDLRVCVCVCLIVISVFSQGGPHSLTG